MMGTEPISTVQRFDEAWNAHDTDRALAMLTDDAVVSVSPPPPGQPGTYRGKREIRTFVEANLPGFHVDARNHQVIGDRVTWLATVVSDGFRQMGVDEVECVAEASLRTGKLSAWSLTFTAETLAKFEAAAARA